MFIHHFNANNKSSLHKKKPDKQLLIRPKVLEGGGFFARCFLALQRFHSFVFPIDIEAISAPKNARRENTCP